MKNTRLVLLACAACAVGGFLVATAAADGPPDTPNEALFYAAYITDDAGVPLAGDQNIRLNVLVDAGGVAGNELCTSGTLTVAVDAGNFRIPVPDTCKEAFNTNNNTWVQLEINGTPMAPSRVGAVPYSLQAGHALTATNAVTATSAATADNAINADNATSVDWAGVQNKPPLTTFSGPNGGEYSLNATFCGYGDNTNGNMGGYTGAKSVCESTCSSPSAHVCTSQEMLRWASTGGVVSGGYSGGWYNSGVGVSGASGSSWIDCDGWLSTSTVVYGSFWAASGQPTWRGCDGSWAVMCCD